MSQFTSWKFAAVICLVAFMSGCDAIQGISIPKDDGPSTAEFRFNAEFIPNAELVRENTTPHWPLGRYAFKRGADRLLVISRITSFAEKLNPDDKENPELGRRYDKVLERVWITIPLGTQIGDSLDLETLERKFLVAYDEGDLDGAIYVQPNRIYGTLRVLEEKSDSVMVDIDMVVQTKRMPNWSYRKVESVPVTFTGIRAKPTKGHEGLPVSSNNGALSVESPVGDTPAIPQVDDIESSDSPAAGEADPVGITQPVAPSIMGKWIGETPPRSQSYIFEGRFQFDADGRFYYSMARTAPPLLCYGTYEIKGKFVVLNVEYRYFKKERPIKTEGKELNKRVQVLRCDPTPDGGMVISVIGPEGATLRDDVTSMRVKPADFQDMFRVPPPRRGE